MNPRSPSRWRSLEWRLPLVSGVFLLVLLVGVSTTIYLELRRATAEAAATRLQTVTTRLAESTRGRFTSPLSVVRASRRDLVLTRFADFREPVASDRAVRVLRDLVRSLPQGDGLLAEIRGADGERLLATDSSGTDGTLFDDPSALPAFGRDTLAVGNLSAYGDHLVFPVLARLEGTARPAYLILWRHIESTQQGLQALRDLIGPQGRFLLSDTSQRLWTDLQAIVPAPPKPLTVPPGGAPPSVVRFERPDSGSRFAAVTRIPHSFPANSDRPLSYSHWIAVVELPTKVVMAPSDAFFTRLLAIAGSFILVALVGVWFLSRSLTKPMTELATAADAFNQGDRSRRVTIDRDDELGTVATALNRMLDGTEQTLARKEKLAVLGQLAGGVGHELRNPLGVMNNAVYYLEAVLQNRSSDVTEYLGILRNQVELSDKIVSDLLDFARVRPPQREPVALPDLVHRQLARAGRHTDVAVEMIFPPDLPPALGDKVQIGQVVLNLLTNAIQAMDGKGGLLQVRGARVDDNRVALEVRDTGPGIAPENLERIFEPLFSTKMRGMGLGLAVSRGLANANGGEIMVRSTAGEGATFTLLLHAVDALPAQEKSQYKNEVGTR